MDNEKPEMSEGDLESISGRGEHEMYMAAIKHLACNNATETAVGQETKGKLLIRPLERT
jgi:hypothetical protein